MARSPWKTASDFLWIVGEALARDLGKPVAALDEDEWEGLRLGLLERLGDGALLGFGLTSPDGRLELVRPQHWYFLELDFDRDRAVGHGLAYYGLRFVEPKRLREVLGELALQPSAGPPPKLTIRAERQCEEWIKAQAALGVMWKKADALAAARQAISGLSERAFRRAWKAEAPAAWKQPGPKP